MPEVKPWKCEDLGLYPKMQSVGRMGQKMRGTKWHLVLFGLKKP